MWKLSILLVFSVQMLLGFKQVIRADIFDDIHMKVVNNRFSVIQILIYGIESGVTLPFEFCLFHFKGFCLREGDHCRLPVKLNLSPLLLKIHFVWLLFVLDVHVDRVLQ
jgi:hypothetical protein